MHENSLNILSNCSILHDDDDDNFCNIFFVCGCNRIDDDATMVTLIKIANNWNIILIIVLVTKEKMRL